MKKDSDIKIGQLEALKECRANEILLNGNEISRDWEITNLQGGRETLSDIMSDNTLVLRYSEMHCDVCIDSIVSKLNIYQDSIGLQNIVLFTSTKNMNYLDLIVDRQKRPFSLEFNDGYKLFYKFSLSDCSSCIESELKNIKGKMKRSAVMRKE